ncbi:MAG: hypothetical protein JKY84_07590 [Emcibacteraceae bacterium]|nr:hypothetical protein [Emcibacteraceae bacterium]
MPSENRDIFFTEHELKIALMQYSRRKGIKFNVENVSEFDLTTKNGIAVAMKVFNAGEGKAGTVKYSQPEIAAALMGYCMKLEVPLPKKGKKSLQSNEDGLYLNIKIL